ncbi:flagellar basal body rod protein FlgB [Catenovulum maritimum]|uniref:Flagellar basal body rod protein FlgB n=1 Tax=Catenovulum maritimum TaxID=1513271 RepID=A0A0J8GW14_9ALTE|nr:flagellar basal body rod protein FlgB [Catenovulum maritimum]KMT65489.1 flagellar basal body rod protein FlgB [Catenovulum maritimum]
MAISFDKAFGIHPEALSLRLKRSEVLASNIANADTPGYKAKDFDFQAALSGARKEYSTSLTRTSDKHMSFSSSMNDGLQYRNPLQPDTGDGNTVELMAERNEFLQNQLRYNSSLQFLTGRIKGLKKAITGQGQ